MIRVVSVSCKTKVRSTKIHKLVVRKQITKLRYIILLYYILYRDFCVHRKKNYLITFININYEKKKNAINILD